MNVMVHFIFFPGGGGGGGWRSTPGEFEIFRSSNVNFATPGSPWRVKFPPLGITDPVQ